MVKRLSCSLQSMLLYLPRGFKDLRSKFCKELYEHHGFEAVLFPLSAFFELLSSQDVARPPFPRTWSTVPLSTISTLWVYTLISFGEIFSFACKLQESPSIDSRARISHFLTLACNSFIAWDPFAAYFAHCLFASLSRICSLLWVCFNFRFSGMFHCLA